MDDVRNIGILEDTTIRWVYPLEGNEGVVGTDLAKLPDQAESMQFIKKTLETVFIGPVNLIQGGSAFIVRMPLLRDDTYWGMASIVLRAENAFAFVEQYTDLHNVDYLITISDQKEEVILGDEGVLEMKPLKFKTEDNLGGWDIYLVPTVGWKNATGQVIVVFILCTIFSLLLSLRIFFWMRNYNRILVDKRKLERNYILDRFTGIYTREYFNFRLKEEVSQNQRKKSPISMIYFDLDHFKNVNDTYGHAAGDEVLLEVVAAVKSLIRGEDVFARWGGDEFILLLPNTLLMDAAYVSERIRKEIGSLEISKAYNVTASVGYSQWKEDEYIESWFLRTDQALYVSKNTGKDKATASDHRIDKNILVKVEWDEASNSGCKRIDDGHRAIIKHCNLIIGGALSEAIFDETIQNVDILISEIEKHFKDEVQILREVNYPYIEKHEKAHDLSRAKIRMMFQKLTNRDIAPIEFFIFLLEDVIEGHFKHEDVKFFQHLKEATKVLEHKGAIEEDKLLKEDKTT